MVINLSMRLLMRSCLGGDGDNDAARSTRGIATVFEGADSNIEDDGKNRAIFSRLVGTEAGRQVDSCT
jgi:hypothetical protein